MAVAMATRKACLTKNKALADAAFLAGLIHDAGKANPWFQKKLVNRETTRELRASHSPASAAIAWHVSANLPVASQDKNRYRLFIFSAIIKHHGNLGYPWADLLRMLVYGDEQKKQIIYEQLQAIDLTGFNVWLTSLGGEMGFEAPDVTSNAIISSIQEARPLFLQHAVKDLSQAVEFLALYGGLLQADKLHSAIGQTSLTRRALPASLVDDYRKIAFSGQPTALTGLRDEIFRTVEDEAIHAKGNFFTLTAPTGSGKTLTVLNAALKLRFDAKASKPRIIYCLPFTSIIDQNFSVIEQVIVNNGLRATNDMLLKHHHLTEISYERDSDLDFGQSSQLLIETWQAEIVVTTFYQFLYTIFTNKNANLKRFTQLKDAIVILDEVQAIPRRYWDAIRRTFTALAEMFNVKFILTTATKPLIFLPEMSDELLTDYHKYFKTLTRIEINNRCKEASELDDFFYVFKNEVNDNPTASRMVVLNQRAPVRQLYLRACKEMSSWQSFCLSTNLTPSDRRHRIDEIKYCLNGNHPCLIFTTQLIEAGVDISVDIVDRDMAPLDSIIQSAGRCNRHAEKAQGIVNIWELVNEHGKPYWLHIYDPQLIEITREVLIESGQKIRESVLPDLAQTYFDRLYKRSAETPIDEHITNGTFSEINKKDTGFVLIDESPFAQSYFIIQNDLDREIWDKYQTLVESENPIMQQSEFNSIKRDFYDRIIQVFKPGLQSTKVEQLLATPDTYTPDTGFISDDLASMIF